MKNVSPRWIPVQFLLWLSVSAAASAQSSVPDPGPCENDPRYRAMDFWIGSWDVETAQGKPAGKSQIDLILGSCVVLENWSGANGYEGKSFNLYRPDTSMWEQIWVDNVGEITKFEGEAREGDIYYRTKSKDSDGAPILRKMTFFRKASDQVRQLGESSKDEGKTWTVDYDLIYKRRR